MKILFIAQLLPYPPDNGPRIKNFNTLKGLSENNEVVLVSFIRSDEERQLFSFLRKYCSEIYTVKIKRSMLYNIYYLLLSMLTRRSFLILRDSSRKMKNLVDNLVSDGNFDLIHIDQLNMAQFVEEIIHIPKVLDQQNVVSTIIKRGFEVKSSFLNKLLIYFEWRKLKKYEQKACGSFDAVFTVSEKDRELLKRLAPQQKRYYVIPIGVDLKDFPCIPRKGGKDLLFVGTMYWPPNIEGVLWFYKEVFSLVLQKVDDVDLHIVGLNPPKKIQSLNRDKQVFVDGYVSNLDHLIAESAVFIVPLRIGSGMRVKILNALAWGIPVVSTTVGCEGIDVTHGKDILIADNPEDFANAIIEVIFNQELVRHLVENGRKLVEEKHDWNIINQRIKFAYQEISFYHSSGLQQHTEKQ